MANSKNTDGVETPILQAIDLLRDALDLAKQADSDQLARKLMAQIIALSTIVDGLPKSDY